MRYLKKFENYSEPQTLVDIIVNSPDHTILKKAVLACGLEKTLAGGEFTVFAPTDYAFEKLPQGTLEALLKDTKALTDILLYHVVPAKALSTSLKDGQMIKTAHGDELMVEIDGEVFVNNMPSVRSNNGELVTNAKVETADLEATNGVVHVIDTVLIPATEQQKIAGSKDYMRSNY